MVDQTNMDMQKLFDKSALDEPQVVNLGAGEWMSVQDASNATGLSMGTLRRYAKAKKIKVRRTGRSLNSKLEVLVTSDLLPVSDEEKVEIDFDANIDEATEALHHEDFESDQADQSGSTIDWLRTKLDQKDRELQAKQTKIEQLLNEMNSATFRLGYLESEKSKAEKTVLLLEDKQKEIEAQAAAAKAAAEQAEKELEARFATELAEKERIAAESSKSTTTWSKFGAWLTGKPAK